MRTPFNRFSAVVCLFTAAIWINNPAFASESEYQPETVKIAIIGDSTVCNYPEENPNRGWGMYLSGYFKDNVQIVNLARGGRSTKTFIQEGLWKKTLDQNPAYILIQFGHNDSHNPQNPESTDAKTDYRQYLRRYIDDSRKIGAQPILITPMHRRTFNDDGTLHDILKPYADAMKAVAAEKKVALIDLHASSGKLFQKLGDEGSKKLASTPTDRTHFNEKGARSMAELVMKELSIIVPEALLSKKVK